MLLTDLVQWISVGVVHKRPLDVHNTTRHITRTSCNWGCGSHSRHKGHQRIVLQDSMESLSQRAGTMVSDRARKR